MARAFVKWATKPTSGQQGGARRSSDAAGPRATFLEVADPLPRPTAGTTNTGLPAGLWRRHGLRSFDADGATIRYISRPWTLLGATHTAGVDFGGLAVDFTGCQQLRQYRSELVAYTITPVDFAGPLY